MLHAHRPAFGRTRMVLSLVTLAAMVVVVSFTFVSGQSGSKPAAGGDRAADRGPLAQFNTDDLTIPAREIRSGGPPKDGIPSLTDPETAPVDQVNYQSDDRVVVVTVQDETRGYPINILNWHEAVNDTLGGKPIAVVYCPLCDSVTVVDRRLGDQTLEFGISGLLYNSNVLLYDRQDDALWSQVGLEAVSGPHAGESLKHLTFQITTFANFKRAHPEADILTTDTGHRRNYSRNPYARYFQSERLYFPVKSEDRRLERKTPVVGIKWQDTVRAYPVAAIAAADDRTVREQFGDETLVLKADEHGNAQILEAPAEASVAHTFWFTWAAFHPETEIYGDSED